MKPKEKLAHTSIRPSKASELWGPILRLPLRVQLPVTVWAHVMSQLRGAAGLTVHQVYERLGQPRSATGTGRLTLLILQALVRASHSFSRVRRLLFGNGE